MDLQTSGFCSTTSTLRQRYKATEEIFEKNGIAIEAPSASVDEEPLSGSEPEGDPAALDFSEPELLSESSLVDGDLASVYSERVSGDDDVGHGRPGAGTATDQKPATPIVAPGHRVIVQVEGRQSHIGTPSSSGRPPESSQEPLLGQSEPSRKIGSNRIGPVFLPFIPDATSNDYWSLNNSSNVLDAPDLREEQPCHVSSIVGQGIRGGCRRRPWGSPASSGRTARTSKGRSRICHGWSNGMNSNSIDSLISHHSSDSTVKDLYSSIDHHHDDNNNSNRSNFRDDGKDEDSKSTASSTSSTSTHFARSRSSSSSSSSSSKSTTKGCFREAGSSFVTVIPVNQGSPRPLDLLHQASSVVHGPAGSVVRVRDPLAGGESGGGGDHPWPTAPKTASTVSGSSNLAATANHRKLKKQQQHQLDPPPFHQQQHQQHQQQHHLYRPPDMDHDYREYYRDNRPRGGEFLTRGAALASQQQVDYQSPSSMMQTGSSGRGSLASHLDTTGILLSGVVAGGPPAAAGPAGVYSVAPRGSQQPPQPQSASSGATPPLQQQQQMDHHEQLEARRYASSSTTPAGPLDLGVRGGPDPRGAIRGPMSASSGKDKIRNPTILRKKLDVCIYLMSAVGIKMEVEDGASITVSELVNILVDEDELNLPRPQAVEVFTLWMTSPLLDVQLKPHHKPFYIRREWNHFLQRFSSSPLERKTLDEPILSFQRNVFFHKRDEVKIRDHKVMELLYEEAKYNILTGRYPCEISDYIMLGGIQARLELGPYDITVHTPSYFRTIMYRFLPEHATCTTGWNSCLPWRKGGTKNSPEARLLEQFKAIPSNASPKRLVRKYLEFCWSLPYYGSAFFHGQIETPTRSLTSLIINHDTQVMVAINAQGFYVIDPVNVVILLGLKLEELSWDYAKPSQENNEDCLPCLFIQFCVIENGRRVSKILQVFSRQAVQMDALISTFVDELKQRVAMYNEDPDGNMFNDSSSTEADDCLVPLTTVSRRGIPESCLSNKLNRLTLATFDDEGHCIGHMGSWSFSN